MRPPGTHPVQELPKQHLAILNQLFEVEKKLSLHGDAHSLMRNINRIKDAYEEMGIFYENPLGQPFSDTRTDVEATISGSGTENLVIVDVVKPIIRVGPRQYSRIVQKGIVIVEMSQEDKND